jgi:hypothetical protein
MLFELMSVHFTWPTNATLESSIPIVAWWTVSVTFTNLVAVRSIHSDAATNLFAAESMVVAAKIIVGVVSAMVFPSISKDEQATTIDKESMRQLSMFAIAVVDSGRRTYILCICTYE